MGNNDDYMERAKFFFFFLAILCSLKFSAMKALRPNLWTTRGFLTVFLEA